MKPQLLLPALLFFLFCVNPATAQTFEEKITKTFQLSKTDEKMLVSIQNLKGYVTVEAYKGNTVTFEIEKIITAQTQADVELGKSETSMNIEERADTIISHISSPFASWRGHKYGNIKFSGDEDEYSFRFNIKVRVPEGISLDVSSIGDVSIADARGPIKVRAHQGLKLTNIAGSAKASAHHGDMEVSYASPIPASSSFHTHHGDIRITVPSEPDADIVFDSYHGDFYTDFPDLQSMPVQANKSVSTENGMKSYKLKANKALRLGKGGISLDFNSHHGSFYLLSKK